MKTIKTYEDFVNEEINWKKSLIGATIVTGLSLSSCDTKTELENKKPQIENLIINDINDLNKRMPEEMAIEFNEIDSINGPIKCPEYYFEEEGLYWPDSLGYESPTIKNKPKVMMGTTTDVYFIISKVHFNKSRYWLLSTYFEGTETSCNRESLLIKGIQYEEYSEAINKMNEDIKKYKEKGIDVGSWKLDTSGKMDKDGFLKRTYSHGSRVLNWKSKK